MVIIIYKVGIGIQYSQMSKETNYSFPEGLTACHALLPPVHSMPHVHFNNRV